MNVRMCAQTRPQFILSSERVFWGMEFEPMLTPREKSPLPENFPRGGSNPRRCGQRAQTLPTSYSSPHTCLKMWMLDSCEPIHRMKVCFHYNPFNYMSRNSVKLPFLVWMMESTPICNFSVRFNGFFFFTSDLSADYY